MGYRPIEFGASGGHLLPVKVIKNFVVIKNLCAYFLVLIAREQSPRCDVSFLGKIVEPEGSKKFKIERKIVSLSQSERMT